MVKRTSAFIGATAAWLTTLVFTCPSLRAQGEFVNFETFSVKPIAIAKLGDENYILVANTPDNSVEIYRVRDNAFQLRELSRRSLFYEQAGALVFFFVNQRGDEGRTRFFEILRRHYELRTAEDMAAELGFQSADDLEREFRAFLAVQGG